MNRIADMFGPAGNVVIATVLDVVKHLMQTRATVQECIKTFDSNIMHAKRTHQLGNIKYGSFPESDATSVIDITCLCEADAGQPEIDTKGVEIPPNNLVTSLLSVSEDDLDPNISFNCC